MQAKRINMSKQSNVKIITRVLILTIYLLVGGAVFQMLEKEHQEGIIDEYEKGLGDFMTKYNVNGVDMDKMEHMILHGKTHSGSPRWSYENSVFFAGSTILTVGMFEHALS